MRTWEGRNRTRLIEFFRPPYNPNGGGTSYVVPPVEHKPMQIGTHDREGWRTHSIPGDVCAGCSDPDSGRWVPISQCMEALAAYEAERAELNWDGS